MECCGRPNRSDAHLTPEEETKIEDQTREYFNNIAPKRHTKPQRSEFSSSPYVDDVSANGSIPENLQFQRLERERDKIVYEGSDQAVEEFVETEYYKDLTCVDKQHHTTGTGFIKMESANGKCFSLGEADDASHHPSCKGNPATNDWIPSAADEVAFVSDKPRRSDV